MWQYIFIAVLAIYAVRSIPKPQSVKPPGFGDVQVPTADPSREIPVIFGTVDIKGPNIVWHGDFSTKAIKAKGGGKK